MSTTQQELDLIKSSPFFLQINGEELTAAVMVAQIEAAAHLCAERGNKLADIEAITLSKIPFQSIRSVS